MSASVVVNGRFAGKRLTGVQRYAREIVARLGERSRTIHTAARDGVPGHRWEQFALPLRCRGSLLWSPCNTGPIAVRRQVVTVHDASYADAPECFSRPFLKWYAWLIPRLVRRVRRVVTVSEFSRRRIAELTGLPAERIDVIGNGVDARFAPPADDEVERVRARYGLGDGPYVLTLGSVEPRKNLATLLRAWPRVAGRRGDLTLAVAGGANLSIFNGQGVGDVAAMPGVRRLGYVDDGDLPALYGGAALFVFPSLYEGFGLPPLEAMACGTPVVSSGTSSLPEVLGDAAAYVDDPRDAEAMADAIVRVIDDGMLRATLAERGRRRAATYTWESAAERTWRVLAEAAADN